MARVLFILRKRGVPYQYSDVQHSDWANSSWTGLGNSVRYVSDMLNQHGIDSKWVAVRDNNQIDREAHQYRPTHCIIEALWVVPTKFKILTKLHPNVKWDIRLHSELPFISQEGMAMEWIFDYYNYPNVIVSSNSTRMRAAISELLGPTRLVPYTPNYYPIPTPESEFVVDSHHHHSDTVHIGCFGAIRPLKNQLIQAVAAILFADHLKKKLVFHINGERLEMGGDPIFRNIVALFNNASPHRLVIDGWVNGSDFVGLVKTMDIGMQVSYSETFNIVSADFAANDVPVVVSPEVTWANKVFMADPNDVYDIVAKLHVAWNGRHTYLHKLNKIGLANYNKHSVHAWLEYLNA